MTGSESYNSTAQPLLPPRPPPSTPSPFFHSKISMDLDEGESSLDEADNLIINPPPSLSSPQGPIVTPPLPPPRRRRTRSVVLERGREEGDDDDGDNDDSDDEDGMIKSSPTYETDDCTSSVEDEHHHSFSSQPPLPHDDEEDEKGKEDRQRNKVTPSPSADLESCPSTPSRGRTPSSSSSRRRRQSDKEEKEEQQQEDPSLSIYYHQSSSSSSRDHSPEPPPQQQLCWGWQKLSEVLISSPTKSAISDPPADYNPVEHFAFHEENEDADVDEEEEEEDAESEDRRRRRKKKEEQKNNENSKNNPEKNPSIAEKLGNSNEDEDKEEEAQQLNHLVSNASTDASEVSVEVYLNDTDGNNNDPVPPTAVPAPPISPSPSTTIISNTTEYDEEESLLQTPNDSYLATPTALSSFSTARTASLSTPSSSNMSSSGHLPQGIQVPTLAHEEDVANNGGGDDDGFETHPRLKKRKEKRSSRMKKIMRKQKSLPTRTTRTTSSSSMKSKPSTARSMKKCASSGTVTSQQQQDLLQVNPPPPPAVYHQELPPSIQSQCNTLIDQAASYEEHLGDYKAALSCLQSCLSLLNKKNCNDNPKVEEDELSQASILHKMGVLYWKMGSYNDSLRVLYYSLDIYRQILLPRLSPSKTIVLPISSSSGEKEYNHEANVMAGMLNSLGRVYLSKGEYEQSMKFYQESLKILKNVYDTSSSDNGTNKSTHPPVVNINHPIIAQTTINIGMVYDALGKYKRSMRYYREGLRAQRACLGNNHVDVATTLNSIGSVYEKLDCAGGTGEQHTKALECYQEALQIYKSTLGNNHVDVAVTLNNIGQVYHHSVVVEQQHQEQPRCRYDQAMSMYVEALRIMKTLLGPTHRNVAATYHNIAQLHVDMDDDNNTKGGGKKNEENIEKALKIYKDVLKVQRASLGDEHVDVAVTLDSMASAHERLGRHEKAIKCYGKALRVRRLALGKKHLFVGVTLDRMGSFHLEKDCNYKESLRRYREALDIYKFNSVGEDDERILSVVKNIEVVSGLIQQPQQRARQQQQREENEEVKETRTALTTSTRSKTKKSIKRMSSSLSNSSTRKSFSSKAVVSPLSKARKGRHRRSRASLEGKG